MSRKPDLFATRNARPQDLKPPRKTAAGDVHCYVLLLRRDNNVSLFRHNLLTDRHLATLRFHNRISSAI